MMKTVLFFRGFNTYETDELRFGPFRFGEAHRHLAVALAPHDLRLVAVPECGRGDPKVQVEKARAFLAENFAAAGPMDLHLLGHSAGGVIARGLAFDLAQNPLASLKIKSVITLNSPHHGAVLAERVLSRALSPWLERALRIVGYDLEKRRRFFEHWRPQTLAAFNLATPDVAGVRYACVVSGLSRDQLPAALRWMQSAATPENQTDGFVERAAQVWGEVLMETQLDHGAILGFPTAFSRLKKRHDQNEFQRMTAKLAAYIQSIR